MARGQQPSSFSSFLQALFSGSMSGYGSNTTGATNGEYRSVGAGQNALPLSEQLKEKNKKEESEKKAAKKKKKMSGDIKQTNNTGLKTNQVQMTGVASVGTGLGIPSNPTMPSSSGRKTPNAGLGTNGGLY